MQKVSRTRAPQGARSEEREKQISVLVGQNIRTLRTLNDISQTALAERLGVTFQQVQKYESGMNRVSAPKLLLMAEIFNTPISTFFSNIETTEPQDAALPTFGKHGLRAARIVETMPPRVQGTALRVLQSLADPGE
ncbi:helix-turn-helix transcriptional regulator [Sinorhizobium sp. 7-81]|uniref:helix-turn-helix domain-containing protein n=1 Tax=Sinorhizobium sp. 8-89 TaxID=3049089 RepID=UPI0024C31828|nr:helix-turn-helix transcriptional regulator [Sinorhizobium sp. 8-89]MDK1490501.1 helix-turn-helix transcriptional regulator [Sinorhizobium sp. 8-89]